MKVAFVLAHRCDGYDISELRQVFVASEFVKKQIKAKVFGVSVGSFEYKNRISNYKCPVIICPSDGDVEDIHDVTSKSLIECLKNFAPDVIFIKGVDYIIAKDIMRTIESRFIFIIGGTYEHELLEQCDGILFESHKQYKSYKGATKKFILPKFINWEFADKNTYEKEFDIINVGTFNEERKAQELLSGLIFYKKVLFVGSGHRLEAFKSLFSHKNAVFVGQVDEEEVYNYINKSKVMVHPSTWDGYPRVVAQSLSCGVPVIGLSHVLDGIHDDIIIRCEIKDLTNTTLDILENKDRLYNLSKKSLDFMKYQNSKENIMNVFEEAIDCVFRA